MDSLLFIIAVCLVFQVRFSSIVLAQSLAESNTSQENSTENDTIEYDHLMRKKRIDWDTETEKRERNEIIFDSNLAEQTGRSVSNLALSKYCDEDLRTFSRVKRGKRPFILVDLDEDHFVYGALFHARNDSAASNLSDVNMLVFKDNPFYEMGKINLVTSKNVCANFTGPAKNGEIITMRDCDRNGRYVAIARQGIDLNLEICNLRIIAEISRYLGEAIQTTNNGIYYAELARYPYNQCVGPYRAETKPENNPKWAIKFDKYYTITFITINIRSSNRKEPSNQYETELKKTVKVHVINNAPANWTSFEVSGDSTCPINTDVSEVIYVDCSSGNYTSNYVVIEAPQSSNNTIDLSICNVRFLYAVNINKDKVFQSSEIDYPARNAVDGDCTGDYFSMSGYTNASIRTDKYVAMWLIDMGQRFDVIRVQFNLMTYDVLPSTLESLHALVFNKRPDVNKPRRPVDPHTICDTYPGNIPNKGIKLMTLYCKQDKNAKGKLGRYLAVQFDLKDEGYIRMCDFKAMTYYPPGSLDITLIFRDRFKCYECSRSWDDWLCPDDMRKAGNDFYIRTDCFQCITRKRIDGLISRECGYLLECPANTIDEKYHCCTADFCNENTRDYLVENPIRFVMNTKSKVEWTVWVSFLLIMLTTISLKLKI